MLNCLLYINGEFVSSDDDSTFESINPATGEIIAKVSRGRKPDIDKAVHAARSAFDNGPWHDMTQEKRGIILKQISDKINERFKELVKLEIIDSGSTYKKAKEDIFLSAKCFGYYSKVAAAFDPVESIPSLSREGISENLVVREPIGVIGAIIPWNFPLKMAVWKIAPALAVGNTIVLKPSEETPVTAIELAKIIDDSDLPKGVVNIIPGNGPDAGEALVKHPDVDKIAFTGSTKIGKHIMSLASETLKKITLECGGKSANIILEDADMEMAVDGALYAIYYHSGQCCEAGSRLFLPDSIHDKFIDKMVKKVKNMVTGDPQNKSTDLGPLISKKQQNRVLEYIKSGVDEGAEIVIGGDVPEVENQKRGFYINPTIFKNVDNKMKISQDEIFGPVLSIIKYHSEDDLINMVNDSIYGLGGAVWSKDKKRAMNIARKMKTGTVWINEYHLISEKAPFGGYKQSGIGREFGDDGLREYTETKHIHIDEIKVRDKKFWYDTVVPQSN